MGEGREERKDAGGCHPISGIHGRDHDAIVNGRLIRMRGGGGVGRGRAQPMALDSGLKAIEIEVDDGRREEGQSLAENQAANDRDAQGAAHFGTGTSAQGQRQGAE